MPYVLLQRLHQFGDSRSWADVVPVSGGLNIRPMDSVIVKLEYSYVPFIKDTAFPPENLSVFTAQLAWAF